MIYIDNRQNKEEITKEFEEKIINTINFSLKEEEVDISCEVSVTFVEEEEIRNINMENRKIDKVTDVLSFPMLEYPKNKVFKDVYKNFEFDLTYLDEGCLVLGDVVLCLQRAREQSKEYNHSYTRECCYLVVHSILHLLGYDHMEDEEKKIMRAREDAILQKLNITR